MFNEKMVVLFAITQILSVDVLHITVSNNYRKRRKKQFRFSVLNRLSPILPF